MKERPILFSAPMIRALLDGSKTQTRRVCKSQPYGNGTWNTSIQDFQCHNDYLPPSALLMDYRESGETYTTSDLEGWVCCPYGQPGDRLWVRETFFAYGRWVTRYSEKKGRDEWHFIDMTVECDRAYQYDADASDVPPAPARGGVSPGWWRRPAIFMPRAACRILLEIVSVRVERLNECSEADANAEGCERLDYFREEHDWKLCNRCGGTRLHRGLGSNGGVIDDVDCRECDAYVKRYKNLWESINGAGSWDSNPWVWVIEFRRIEP